ncbi:Phospholipid biosynthesis protein PlsY [Commensalibacter communis]|uniref:Glycerol-3-phosphate acyltransferase n=1 Tax=Commensalibacter communis TaxID=2972786 RepID=A0A9W4TLH2_9PROT|nr:Phospholipid biosynthesis protein PlsY [Commensalibacter communis]CAI3926926.1 Phospholipid biosynthesis protein PlsY [Commensalibacter communis]CAI3926962.1 Phospholipid biosynthesis protein PlsY [Commensalibacter communis]CAI3927757.1 Phospholipid biosynthesis protein PlsY [Commensalibacter communis]CAI3927772.1 Phospholipid biosynthesis protein PlsY [Commensalibacter communis]
MMWHIPPSQMPLMGGIALISYLIGSIPFGMLISQLGGMGDIRKIGSGNIGATNVLRTGNKKLAALTLLCDMGKGTFAVACGYIFGLANLNPAISIAAICVVLGHCFPIWLGFKGGKGVATGLGAALALTPISGALCCAIWLLGAKLSKISSMGALSAFIAWPLLVMIESQFDLKAPLLFPSLIISLLVIWRHHANIQRLMDGTEPRIGDKKEQSSLSKSSND